MFLFRAFQLIVSFLFLVSCSKELAPPRPKFWNYPSVEEANYEVKYLDNGMLSLHLTHAVLKGVTPKMVAWWYRHLSMGQYEVQGRSYTFYHLFHLSEHGVNKVLKPGTDGELKMGKGAIVYRREKFGPFYSEGKGYVEQFDDHGFKVIPKIGPLEVGQIRHEFKEVEGGTLYKVETLLGSDAFLLGTFINLFIRHIKFPEEAIQQWVRHQVEEVGSLVHYLPEIYREQKKLY